ncbi:MAG: hypothetical protein H6923_00800 [Alphaproteobacteria bacterium]|nr:hypothetical protein [Alphaproteobacteria bacterium]
MAGSAFLVGGLRVAGPFWREPAPATSILAPIPDPERNATARLLRLLDDPGGDGRLLAPVVARLGSKGGVLLVPALLGGLGARIGLGALADEARLLARHGIRAHPARLSSSAPVAANAERLLQEIAAAPGPLLLVAFSKGGLDSLEALRRAPSALREKVLGLATVQSPVHGSPLADALLAHPAAPLARAALALLAGSGEALVDCATATRAAYFAAHGHGVTAILERMAAFSVASTVAAGDASAFARLPSRAWIAEDAGANDGLVAVRSAILPGAPYAVLPGLGHSETRLAGRSLVPALLRLLIEGAAS